MAFDPTTAVEDTPKAFDPSTAAVAAPGVKATPSAASQKDRDDEQKAILYAEFPKAQQALNEATASGDAANIARAKADLESLVREIARTTGAVPSINVPTPQRMAASGDTASGNVLPDNQLAQRAAYAGMGAAGAASTTAVPIAKMQAALAVKKRFVDRNENAAGKGPVAATAPVDYEAQAADANKKYMEFLAAKAKNAPEDTSGMYRYMKPLVGDPNLMPSEQQIAGVTSTRADDPTGAHALNRKNAAGLRTLTGMGIDPLSLHKEKGIYTIPSVQDLQAQALKIGQQRQAEEQALSEKQARISTLDKLNANMVARRTPPPDSGWSSNLSALKDYAAKAGMSVADFLKNPHAMSASIGAGVGSQVPEISESVRKKEYGQAALDAAKGAAYGVAPAFLPAVAQRGLAAVASPLAFLGNEWDAYKRLHTDPVGSAISSVGGLMALAPMKRPSLPALAVGAVGALGPPIINYFRDPPEKEAAENYRRYLRSNRMYGDTDIPAELPTPTGADPRMAP